MSYSIELHNEYGCTAVYTYGKKTDVIRDVTKIFGDLKRGFLKAIEVTKDGYTSLYLSDGDRLNSYIALRPNRHGLVLRPVNDNVFVYDRETGECLTTLNSEQKAIKWLWEK